MSLRSERVADRYYLILPDMGRAAIPINELLGSALASARVPEAQTLASGTLHWAGGQFSFTPLPAEAQAGPLLCGVPLPDNRLLIGSGFRGVQPYEGPYDALLP